MTLCIVDGGHCNCPPDEGMVCDKLPKKVQHYVLTAVKTALEDAIPREIHERLIAERDEEIERRKTSLRDLAAPQPPAGKSEEARCAVCGAMVRTEDQAEHLSSQHAGPYYFWLNGKLHKAPSPSMTAGQIKDRYNIVRSYQLSEWRADLPLGRIDYNDGQSIDLTHKPDLHALPPATM